MTTQEYLIIGAICFASSYTAAATFALVTFLRKRASIIEVVDKIKQHIDTEISFKNIVENNFRREEDN